MKYATAQPYIASYLIIRKDGRIPFVLRANTSWMNGYYGLASGKVEDGESFAQAVIREAKEEIGITIQPENLRQILTCHRREADEAMSWVDVVFEATSWEGEAVNAEPHMHSELAWLEPEQLPTNVIPSVRFMLERIAAGETYCEYGWN